MIKYLSVYIISLGFFFLNIQRTRYVSIDIEDTKHKFITLEDEQPKKKKRNKQLTTQRVQATLNYTRGLRISNNIKSHTTKRMDFRC